MYLAKNSFMAGCPNVSNGILQEAHAWVISRLNSSSACPLRNISCNRLDTFRFLEGGGLAAMDELSASLLMFTMIDGGVLLHYRQHRLARGFLARWHYGWWPDMGTKKKNGGSGMQRHAAACSGMQRNPHQRMPKFSAAACSGMQRHAAAVGPCIGGPKIALKVKFRQNEAVSSKLSSVEPLTNLL